MTDSIIIEKIDIPVAKKNYLQTKIDKINRKAKKMGCEPLVLVFDNEHVYTYNVDHYTGAKLAFPRHIDMCTANLIYQIPIIEGYELIARLDIYPTVDGGNEVMVSAVPEKKVPAKYMNKTEIHCDHCGWKRNRNHSILLQHTETGEYKEVGSTCVKDFFGIDPKGFMLMASIKFDELINGIDTDDRYQNEMKNSGGYDIIEVFAVSAAAIAKWGWLSKGKAWELNKEYDASYISTASHVIDNLDRESAYYAKMDDSLKVHIENEDIELAKKVYEYFTNLDPKNNDYLINCCKIIRIGYVPYNHIGITCSMVSAYNREIAKIEKIEADKKSGEVVSEWQGAVGQRLKDITVECTYTRTFQNDFGEQTLYAFKDANGNVYKTFYSGYKWSCEVGDIVMITGTVKKHNEFQGKKETMMNRVVTKDAPSEAFAANEFVIA